MEPVYWVIVLLVVFLGGAGVLAAWYVGEQGRRRDRGGRPPGTSSG